MTRFSSKALPSYVAEPYQSPMAGVWNMLSAWYSTSPEFRESLASLFRSESEPKSGFDESFDTTMAYPELFETPELGKEGAKRDVEKILTGTEGDTTNWMQPIVVGVRESNDYIPGTAVRRETLAKIPELKVIKPEWMEDL